MQEITREAVQVKENKLKQQQSNVVLSCSLTWDRTSQRPRVLSCFRIANLIALPASAYLQHASRHTIQKILGLYLKSLSIAEL